MTRNQGISMLKRMLLFIALTMIFVAPALAEGDENPPGFHPQLVPEAGGWGQAVATAVWTIVIFLIMLIILYPTAWKSVLKGLKAREDRIRKDIADAEAARTSAEKTLNDYKTQLASAEAKVREMIASATAQGEKISTALRMQAQQEGEEAKQRATRDIEAARDAALRQIYEQTANLSTAIAEKIIRRNLNAADQQELVRESLEQLQTTAAK